MIERRVALFAHLHVNKDAAPEMYRLPIQPAGLPHLPKMQYWPVRPSFFGASHGHGREIGRGKIDSPKLEQGQ